MRHTVVFSDVHLCEVEPGSGLWMRYRQRPFVPDPELAAMLDALRARVADDELTLVLGGDVFDFDAPRVVGGESVFHDLPRTAENAVEHLEAILADHGEFMAAIGRVLGDGHRVVVLAGNHDVQLTLPAVRERLRARFAEAAEASGLPRAKGAGSRVEFRAWFYKGEDGVLVEHGNQYDRYCSYRYPMAPFHKGEGREIQPTMGSLATRLLISRFGFFNPHVDESFMLSPLGYMAHWMRYYFFSDKTLVGGWATGAARMLLELLRRRDPGSRERTRQELLRARDETGEPLLALARHRKLFARPVEDELRHVVRELWVDRALLFLFGSALAGAGVALLRGPAKLLALASPLPLAIYELLCPKPTLDDTWALMRKKSRKIAKVHGARAVIFGHTHLAEGSWEGGVFFGNSGSWSSAYKDIECTQPLTTERPLVWLRSEPGGPLLGGLYAWKDGEFLPTEVREGSDAPESRAPRPAPRPALLPHLPALEPAMEPEPLSSY